MERDNESEIVRDPISSDITLAQRLPKKFCSIYEQQPPSFDEGV